jgi:hypothetical protein
MRLRARIHSTVMFAASAIAVHRSISLPMIASSSRGDVAFGKTPSGPTFSANSGDDTTLLMSAAIFSTRAGGTPFGTAERAQTYLSLITAYGDDATKSTVCWRKNTASWRLPAHTLDFALPRCPTPKPSKHCESPIDPLENR